VCSRLATVGSCAVQRALRRSVEQTPMNSGVVSTYRRAADLVLAAVPAPAEPYELP
jgi:hypothetical protein